MVGTFVSDCAGNKGLIWEIFIYIPWRIWCFWTVVLEKTFEGPLDSKEIQSVNPKASQSWIFIGRTDAEAEAPIFWLLDVKRWLIGKDPDAGKDWRQDEKGTTENEMVGWHHWLNGHELDQALKVGDGQGGLACCSSRGRKESDTTERLNWTELNISRLVSRRFLTSDFWFLSMFHVTVFTRRL